MKHLLMIRQTCCQAMSRLEKLLIVRSAFGRQPRCLEMEVCFATPMTRTLLAMSHNNHVHIFWYSMGVVHILLPQISLLAHVSTLFVCQLIYFLQEETNPCNTEFWHSVLETSTKQACPFCQNEIVREWEQPKYQWHAVAQISNRLTDSLVLK